MAARFLHDDELVPVRAVREGRLPDSARERIAVEAVRAGAEVMAPRTIAIDHAVTSALLSEPDAQVVILGAGLDGRPWRLSSLAGRTTYAVDHPASLADAEDRAAGLEPLGRLVRVPIDLTREPLDRGVSAAGHDADRPTVWLWEGVIPYLTRIEVLATLDALTSMSAPGSRLVAQYQAPSLAASVGRRFSVEVSRLSGTPSVLADEPWRSRWPASRMADVLRARGWEVTSHASLLHLAEMWGTPTTSSRSLASGRVVVADR